MAGPDVAQIDERIADRAQQMIESESGRLHGDEFCKRAGTKI